MKGGLAGAATAEADAADAAPSARVDSAQLRETRRRRMVAPSAARTSGPPATEFKLRRASAAPPRVRVSAMAAANSAKTLLRAPIVSELRGSGGGGSGGARGGPWDWPFLTAFTWAATIGGGLVVASMEYPGNSRGDHALRGLQRRARALYEDIILAAAPAASPPPPPAPPSPLA